MDRILVVDDELSIRELLKDFLETQGYSVTTAQDGVDALEVLKNDQNFDLILSDVNMPRMMGFELLHEVEKQFPYIKRVLITAYDVEDYISLAIKFGISNIITKTAPFNFDEISAIIKSLIEGKLYGLQSFLAKKDAVKKIKVLSPKDVYDYAVQVMGDLDVSHSSKNLEIVIVEMLNNAIYYGIKDYDAKRKEDWDEDFKLNPGEVDLLYGRDDEKYAISITDNGGKLTKAKVLHWLGRQMQKDERGLPIGILDIHGRGIYISREYVDRLVINIHKGKYTEIICLHYIQDAYKGHKPLLINEI
jgi:CheY-like chemotaxis protein